MRLAIRALGLLVLACVTAGADEPTFQGEWRTSLGVVTFKPEGEGLTATFSNPGIPPVKGTVKDKTTTLKSREAQNQGNATLTLDDTGRSFSGWFQFGNGQRAPWNGWRPDPEATKGEAGQFGGLWLTTLGLMELDQDGDKASGRYAVRGTSKIEGDITGRRLKFHYHWFRNGQGWFDLTADGKKLEGAAVGDGANAWYGWQGRRAPEFRRHVALEPGKIVDGSTKGMLTYSVRAPDGFKPGDPKRWPAIVILHGSNTIGRAYVATMAAAWPEIARDYLILGLNGEVPSNIGEDPQFNYSYVNYVGRSTYRGFPGTDRESPALVAEALAELKQVYPIARYFVGGHSQGGFLTYSLLMNTPELLAGAFAISSGVIFQCEPGAYSDEALRQAQRAVPLAIIHGQGDPVVEFGMDRYAANLFADAGWPAVHFFTSGTAGHNFQQLPVAEAIRWLESLASNDPDALLGLAEKQAKAGRYRDAVAALRRARDLKLDDARKQRADQVAKSIDAKAKAGADEFLPEIKKNAGTSWIDRFLAYRDEFALADGAREAMSAFGSLRDQHEPQAQRIFGEARGSFQQGKRDEGYAKFQEIVDKYYASTFYRNVKEQLKSRPSR